jgi:hypothetical protein
VPGDERLVGTVVVNSFLGAVSRISVDLGAAGIVIAQLPTAEAVAHTLGSRVRLTLRPDPVLVTTSGSSGSGSSEEPGAGAGRADGAA